MKIKLIAVVSVIALAVAAWLFIQKQERDSYPWFKKAPKEHKETISRIVEYTKERKFDRAIALALEAKTGRQTDDFLLQSVADIYFERAQYEPAESKKWIALALEYSEQALHANPGNLTNDYNLGEAYLTAAMNVEGPAACPYYDKSLQLFETLKDSPVLKKENLVIEDETVDAESYRRELDRKIDKVQRLRSSCATQKVWSPGQ